MKICRICNVDKDETQFDKSKSNRDKLDHRCKDCRKTASRAYYKIDPFSSLYRTKKAECKIKGIAFDLTPEYLRSIWTGVCPISGEKITIGNSGRGSHRSGHLDRIIPSEGYLVGNVSFLSGRMNRIKYDATSSELRAIASWIDSQERATTIPTGSTPQANGGGSGEPQETE